MKERVSEYNELLHFKLSSKRNLIFKWRFNNINRLKRGYGVKSKIAHRELEKRTRHYRIRSW